MNWHVKVKNGAGRDQMNVEADTAAEAESKALGSFGKGWVIASKTVEVGSMTAEEAMAQE